MDKNTGSPFPAICSQPGPAYDGVTIDQDRQLTKKAELEAINQNIHERTTCKFILSCCHCLLQSSKSTYIYIALFMVYAFMNFNFISCLGCS